MSKNIYHYHYLYENLKQVWKMKQLRVLQGFINWKVKNINEIVLEKIRFLNEHNESNINKES